MLDEATIERIVREVIRRLLEVNPSLFSDGGGGDSSSANSNATMPGDANVAVPRAYGERQGLGMPQPLGMRQAIRSPQAEMPPRLGFSPGTAPGLGARYASSTNSLKTPLVTEHHGRVLIEYDLVLARRSGHKILMLSRRTVITPLAKDRARDMGIELRYRD